MLDDQDLQAAQTKNKQNDYESFDHLERIHSKIEEKQSSRAETSHGISVEVARKYSSNPNGPRRCPNLQQIIVKKKLEEGVTGVGQESQRN